MRIFIDNVESCIQCPYCSITKQTDVEEFDLWCNRTLKPIAAVRKFDDASVPDWCPFYTEGEVNEAMREQQYFDKVVGNFK